CLYSGLARDGDLFRESYFFFQAEDGIRDRNVTGVRRVLFRSPGVFGKSFASTAISAWPRIVAIAVLPMSAACLSDMTTNAHAPSFTPGAFPAVIVPSASITGGNLANFSGLVSLRGPSSESTTMGSPLRCGTSTG